jgi:hypothetical protein
VCRDRVRLTTVAAFDYSAAGPIAEDAGVYVWNLWLSQLPHAFIENVASIPWTVIGMLVGAVAYARASLPRYWIAFTACLGLLALDPFVHIAGQNMYVPSLGRC